MNQKELRGHCSTIATKSTKKVQMQPMMQNAEARKVACANCGGGEFEWGWAHSRGMKQFLLYSNDDESRWWPFIGRQIRCRRCIGCNQITFFCDSERCPLIL